MLARKWLERIRLACGVVHWRKDFSLTSWSGVSIAPDDVRGACSMPPGLLSSLDETTAAVRQIEEVFEDGVVGELNLTFVVLHLLFVIT